MSRGVVVSRHNGGGGTSSYTQATSSIRHHHHHGKGPRSSHHGPRSSSGSTSGAPPQGTGNLLSCNRCRKPVATTVFVCKCDCLFCQSCTYSHFSESSQCPACGMTLGTEDFLELCIADPSKGESSSAKMSLQNMLTKSRSDSTHLTHQDMCMHVLQSVDQTRRSCKFLLKQMVRQQASQAQTAGSLHRAYEKLQAEHTQLQQSVNSERLANQQSMQELKNLNAALTNQLHEMEGKMKDQQRQIDKFREHFRSTSTTPAGSSAHSIGSSSSANRNERGQHLMMQHRHQPQQASSPTPPPPMQAFVKNKAMAAASTNRQSSNQHPFPATTPIHISNSFDRPSSAESFSGPPPRVLGDLRNTSSYSFGPNHHRSGGGHSPAMVFAKPQRGQSFQGGFR
ncbi:hypothetical protein ACA910_019408 [Epithemia clementina (nom. ined.)]